MKKHHVVTAAIITNKDQYLCMQRGPSKFDYAGFKWEFPGGKVEDGESLLEALSRELLEEMELEVAVLEENFLMTVEHEYPDFKITMHGYIVPVESREFVLREHVDHKWLNVSELMSLDWTEADVPMVRQLMETEMIKIKKKAFLGSGYYCDNYDEVVFLDQCLICVNEAGVIEQVLKKEDSLYNETLTSYKNKGFLHELEEDEIMLPGFVDLHIHGPQWAQSGTALDRPLEVWLGEYTFPLEAKFKDQTFAKSVYEDVVDVTLKNGTTTGVYFATVDVESSVLLANICGEKGQRGFVGKIAMDDVSGCPDYYRDADWAAAVRDTERFINGVLDIQEKYKQSVYPVVTPRFIPSCTSECLEGLGELVKKYDVHVQTHASESDWAHGFVKEKMGKNDVKALSDFGLLGNKSLIAHAPFLEKEDLDIMVSSGTTIAHCPLSNAYFANSVLPVNDFIKLGVSIGLATDISGGYSPSMYQAIRQAVVSSKMLNDGVNPELTKTVRGRKEASITLNIAFYLATVGGGKALGLPIGKLEEGYIFDVQVVNTRENIPRFGQEKNKEDLLHKVLLLGQTVNVREVWVQGELVK